MYISHASHMTILTKGEAVDDVSTGFSATAGLMRRQK